MSDAICVQAHDAGDECDTYDQALVPIIFVPGVMGSRITMAAASRTWDADSTSKMLSWIPLTDSGRRQNRRALSPRSSGAAVLTTLSSDALTAVAGSGGLGQIYALATGGPPGPDGVDRFAWNHWQALIGPYYGAQRNWSSVLWSFYGPLLLFLEAGFNAELRHPVFAFGYDWRDSCATSGGRLAEFVKTTVDGCKGAKDAIIITHSMGGLVLRGALKADAGVAAKIRGVIHGAQPSTGAVVCYRRFFTGCVPGFDGNGGVGSQAWFLNRVMGNTPARFAYNLSGSLGPVQLLPNHVYQKLSPAGAAPWLSGAGATFDLGDVYNLYRRFEWPGIMGPIDAAQNDVASHAEHAQNRIFTEMLANLDAAEQFHRDIETTAHANTLVVYSTQLPTEVRIEFGTYPPNPPRDTDTDIALAAPWQAPTCALNAAAPNDAFMIVRREDEGDGTVPAVSGRCPGLILARPAEFGASVEHSGVYSNAEFQAVVRTMVKMLVAVPVGTSMAPQ
jgi:hypothetical protein